MESSSGGGEHESEAEKLKQRHIGEALDMYYKYCAEADVRYPDSRLPRWTVLRVLATELETGLAPEGREYLYNTWLVLGKEASMRLPPDEKEIFDLYWELEINVLGRDPTEIGRTTPVRPTDTENN